MTSEYTAQDILQNLEELDEETNLSLRKKSSSSKSKKCNNDANSVQASNQSSSSSSKGHESEKSNYDCDYDIKYNVDTSCDLFTTVSKSSALLRTPLKHDQSKRLSTPASVSSTTKSFFSEATSPTAEISTPSSATYLHIPSRSDNGQRALFIRNLCNDDDEDDDCDFGILSPRIGASNGFSDDEQEAAKKGRDSPKRSATSINDKITNPTGMVISTSDLCFAEEAILDPTWLDSVNDGYEDEEDKLGDNNENFHHAVDTKFLSNLLDLKQSNVSGSMPNNSKNCGDAVSDNISLASSLCVGSCDFGKVDRSTTSVSEIDDYSIGEMSYADVVDMGLSSNDSNRSTSTYSSSSQHHVLEHLYDMDGYVSDDLSTDNPSMKSSILEKKDHNEAYLPEDLLTPPRVIRRSENEIISFDVKLKVSDNQLDEGGSNSDKDDDCLLDEAVNDVVAIDTIKASIPTSFSLDEERFAGIVRGDTIISILDCPGNKTRKKRKLRSKLGKKKNKFNEAFSGDFHWCKNSVQKSLNLIRKVRMSESLSEASLSYDEFCKSTISPIETGETAYSFDDFSSCSQHIATKHHEPDQCIHLENDVMKHLENNNFEGAITSLEEILCLFATRFENSQRFNDDSDLNRLNIARTLQNIGIVHLLRSNFDESIQVFERAMNIYKSINDERDIYYITNVMMLGVACYAVEAFELCRSYWNKALKAMRNFKEKPSVIEFELLNNLGCLEYETGNEGSALKRFEESLKLQRKYFTCNIYKEGQAACQHMLLKLAITQANIGYVHLRLKNPDAAITAFERSKKDFGIILDEHHSFALAVQDYIALAFLCKGDKRGAISVYSKMLTVQIMQHESGDNVQCTQTLIKLKILQAKKYDKENMRTCLKNINEFIRDNKDPCQHERMEKLLKLSGIVVTVLDVRVHKH